MGCPSGFPKFAQRRDLSSPAFTIFGNKTLSENWQHIAEYELRACGSFLGIPRFTDPGTFFGSRLKIEIYTDASARSPFVEDSITWESGIGIGGVLVVSGEVIEFPSLEINAKSPIG